VLGKKTPVGMLDPVVHVELAYEFFNELPSVFALEPAKKSALPFSAFVPGESGVFVYDGPLDRMVKQISQFVPEVFETFQADDPLRFYNFDRQVNEPDHRPQTHGSVLVRAQIWFFKGEKVEKT
jgi:hypothetical protein